MSFSAFRSSLIFFFFFLCLPFARSFEKIWKFGSHVPQLLFTRFWIVVINEHIVLLLFRYNIDIVHKGSGKLPQRDLEGIIIVFPRSLLLSRRARGRNYFIFLGLKTFEKGAAVLSVSYEGNCRNFRLETWLLLSSLWTLLFSPHNLIYFSADFLVQLNLVLVESLLFFRHKIEANIKT